jgi:hypothetical protein
MCNRSRSQESELGPWEGGKPPADAARKLIEEGKIRLRSAVTFERRLGNFMSNRSRKREPATDCAEDFPNAQSVNMG